MSSPVNQKSLKGPDEMKGTFASIKRWLRMKAHKPEPSNVVDLEAKRRERWLIKHTRPMPPKDAA